MKEQSKNNQGQNSDILSNLQKNDILGSFNKPNTQFIQRGKQLNKRAKELEKLFKMLKDDLKISGVMNASTRTGSGFLINSMNLDFSNVDRDKIIEVIDYDPVRNNLMVIGSDPPPDEVALHWFIYRGLMEINGIIILDDSNIIKNFQDDPLAKFIHKEGLLNTEFAIEVTKHIKDHKIVALTHDKLKGVLLVGRSLDEAYNLLRLNVEKFSRNIEQK